MNLLDSLNGFLTGDSISKAAMDLNESPDSISKALRGIIPTVLGKIVEKAGTGSAEILTLARQAATWAPNATIGDLSAGENKDINGGKSAEFVNGLFGGKLKDISSAISSFAGIKSSSANALMNAVVPFALGAIGKYVNTNSLSEEGLVSWLNGQKNSFSEAVPAGLNVVAPHTYDSPVAETVIGTTTIDHSKMPGWIMPLLLILLGGLLVWYFLNGSDGSQEMVAAPVPTVVSPEAVAEPVSLKVKLADGTELNALKGGIEEKLVACMTDSLCTPGKDRWFDFDNLNFEMGSARITPESEVQVQNIAAILKAYPGLKIKIGGYTDKTGDAAVNKKLSQDRADAVLDAIKTAGGNAAQLEGAEGYGSDFATVPATASDAERKVDRRISVSVRAK